MDLVDLDAGSQLKKEQQQRWGPGIRRRQTPIIYRVTTGYLSEQTKSTYQCHINDFLAFYKIDNIANIEPLKEYSPKLIRQMVLDFVIYLRDVRQVSRSSIKVHCAALSLFFYMIRDDDTRLDWTKVKMEFPPDERIRRDRAYTIEEIQRILSVCSRIRDKVIILLLESTGMRIGGIHPLKFGDLTPKTTPQGEEKVYQIEVYSGSSAHYYCYCNVETANAIDEYLKERTAKGEILQNDTPLIRDLKTLNTKNVKPLTSYNIRYTVSKIVEKSGIRNTFQFTGEAKRSKGFRKFYKTQAESSGMKPVHVELTHGHSIGISGAYYRPAESDLLEDYMGHAADALTISTEHRLKTKVQQLEGQQTEEIERLKTQLGSYKEELAKAKQYQDTSMLSIQELEARMKSTEDKYERTIMACEYVQKSMPLLREKEKKRFEEMSPRMRKLWLDWEKTSEMKGESFTDYYIREREKRLKIKED